MSCESLHHLELPPLFFVTTVPDTISRLTNLTTLVARDMSLQELPSSMSVLTNLRSLDLVDGGFENMPEVR